MNLERATTILISKAIRSGEVIKAWRGLAARFQKAKEEDEQDDEDLGEIPDELLGMYFFLRRSIGRRHTLFTIFHVPRRSVSEGWDDC